MMVSPTVPNPENSIAVLIGSSNYETLDQLPAVRNNVAAMKRLLTDRRVWGLSADSCVTVEEPVSPNDLMRPISNGLARATDCFVLYFAGHGFLGDHGELCLAISGSDGVNSYSGVPYQWVRRELLKGRPRRTVVIIDCCHSGLAGRTLGGSASVASDAVVEGAYVMTSVADNKKALSLPGDQYTAFTGELISVLSSGISTGVPILPIDEIYREVYRKLASKGHPRPKSYEGDTGGLVAFYNRAGGVKDSSADSGEQAELPDTPIPQSAAILPRVPGGRSIGKSQWRPTANADTPFALRLNTAARNLSLEVYGDIAADIQALDDAGCMELEWNVAPGHLMGKWAEIRSPYRSNGATSVARTAAITGIDLSGSTNDILGIVDMVPSRRLAFLGKAGSGKSTVLKLACNDMLSYSHGSWPVPVPLDMTTWNASRESLQHWVRFALGERYAAARGAAERNLTLSQALLDTGQVLLVLDNFDEMSPVNRVAALNKLSASAWPFLLASRLYEFEDAIGSAGPPSAMAAVVLRDLDVSQARDHVARLAEKDQPRAQGWKDVAAHLGSPSAADAEDPLVAALSTPRMIQFLGTGYEASRDDNPAALLDRQKYPDSESVERSILAAASDALADSFAVRTACCLDRESASRVAWWQINGSGKLRTHILLSVVPVGIVSLICTWILSFIYWPPSYSWDFAGAVAIIAILATGMSGFRAAARTSKRPWDHWDESATPLWRTALTGALAGAVIGLICSLPVACSAYSPEVKAYPDYYLVVVPSSAAVGVLVAATLMTAAGTAVIRCVIRLLDYRLDPYRRATAQNMLRSWRNSALGCFFLSAIPVGLIVAAIFTAISGQPAGSLAFGAGAGVLYGFMVAVAPSPFVGHILANFDSRREISSPVSRLEFLRDRGLIRRSGCIYEFIDDRLISIIAAKSMPESAPKDV